MTSINQVPIMQSKKKIPGKESKNKNNWLIYTLFCRNEFAECLGLIDEISKEHNDLHEFAYFIKGLILRMNGSISQSFELLKKCHNLNEMNVEFLKQICRSLYLMGKHKASIEVANEALKFASEDWEIHHAKGLAYLNLRDVNSAIESFKLANANSKHDATFLQIGKTFTMAGDLNSALQIYKEAFDYTLENSEICNAIGLLYMSMGQNFNGFQSFAQALSIDTKNSKAILAVGSIIQERGDYDSALTKYKIAANGNPNSAHLWNNIGMCFFGKQKYIAALTCLKKAFYLDPFEWVISYNLGIVHYNTEQYASAFHFFNNAINLMPKFAKSYMYLGMTLNKLEDFPNACFALERSIELDPDYITLLNYIIMLLQKEEFDKAKHYFELFQEQYSKIDLETRSQDADVVSQYEKLTELFKYI